MKKLTFVAIFFTSLGLAAHTANAQEGKSFDSKKIKNLIVITTDGLRWQEVFGGMDSAIANQKKFNQGDSAKIYKNYWAASPEERRKKLMPFFWSVISSEGQLYGNRRLGNKVDVTNPHNFSYPGYSEIFTGIGDPAINSNNFPPNPHTNVLEFLNKQPGIKGKVAAFCAWDAFDRILNEQRSGFPVQSSYDTLAGNNLAPTQLLVNQMLRDSYSPWGKGECLDVFTHYAAMEYLKKNQPRVLYIGYGETDEWAHSGEYSNYLTAANQFDKWVQQIWEYIQRTPAYRNNTAILITTDHGRGDLIKNQWTDHGAGIKDANEIWFSLLGAGITKKGELKTTDQHYQKQMAQTIANLLGFTFSASHEVAAGIR